MEQLEFSRNQRKMRKMDRNNNRIMAGSKLKTVGKLSSINNNERDNISLARINYSAISNVGNVGSRHKARGYGNLFLTIVLCMISLGALTGCIVLILENQSLKQQQSVAVLSGEVENSNLILPETVDIPEAPAELPETVTSDLAGADKIYSEAEALELGTTMAGQAADEAADGILNTLKTQLVEGEDFSAILRDLYPGDMVVIAEGNYHFVPISENLKKHDYNPDLFVLDEKEILSYQDENGGILSQKGIDVSRYQNDIDWEKVAGDGVEFAFIRLGIRGSAEGTLVLDPQYEANIEGAAANGVDTGVYFFTQALNEAEAVEEAEFVLENLAGRDITYPVVLDVEAIETNNPRTKNMTREDWTKVTVAFCERIKEAGYTPMIYGNLRSFILMLDMEQLEDYEKWFAFFRTPIYFPYEHSIWQYSSTGKVNGIKGNVDINIAMKDFKSGQEEESETQE